MSTLLYSAALSIRLTIDRIFDFDIRTLPTIVNLYDVETFLLVPEQKMYDVVVYYIRDTTSLNDPFTATKDDATSFFSINEQNNEVINSTYISTNLKVITPFSEVLNRPLSQFDLVKATSSLPMSESGTDDYVALNFEDVVDYNTLEIVRPGVTCVVLGTIPLSNIPGNGDDFITIADNTSVLGYGVLSNLTLLQNPGSRSYCSFYYGFLDIPNGSTTYYFSLIASTVGFMYIDDILLISQSSIDSTTPALGSITLTKGHHTFLIKHFSSSASTTDEVRLQFTTTSNGTYVDFSVANLASVSVTLSTFPIYFYNIISQADFADVPNALVDASLDSLRMQIYRPIIVMARKNSELLLNEFNRTYYTRNPDSILTSPLISGSTNGLLDGYDFPIVGNGIVVNGDRSQVPSPFITYLYNVPTKISRIEIRDAAYYGSTAVDGKQCFGFSLSLVNDASMRIRSVDLINMIDLSESTNIQSLLPTNNSDTYLKIVKSTLNDHVIIVFKPAIFVQEITIRDPVIMSINWGSLLSFKVSLEATKIVKVIDNKGSQTVVGTIDDNIVQVAYEDVGYIPSLFKSQHLPPDIRYGAEFVMFCLALSGGVTPVNTLGSLYEVANPDNNNVFNSLFLLNYMQMCQSDSRKFALYTDLQESGSYDFVYVGYSTAQNVVMQSAFTSLTMIVTNTGATTLTNMLYTVLLPNTGVGYSCVNQSSVSIPVAGITSSNALTASGTVWDTNQATIKIPTLTAGNSTTLTFTHGSFSSTALLTGSAATTYTYLPDILQLPIVAVEVPVMTPDSVTDIVALNAVTIPTASTNTYNIPTMLTVALVDVTEMTGVTRSNVEIVVDMSDLQGTFKCPFKVYDSNMVALDTVGVNNDNSVTTDFSSWNGFRIRFRAPVLLGGMDTLFLIRVGMFQGTASSFIPVVQSGMSYQYHFSGCLIDTITGAVGTDGGVFYNSDKYLNYQQALQFITGNTFARVPVVTTTSNFTLSFWFMTMSTGSGIMCLTNTTTMPATVLDFKFTINTSGFLQCTILSGSGAMLNASDKTYADNQWHHVVVTCSSTLGTVLYVDKVQKATNAFNLRTITTAYAVFGWADTYFIGSVDEFRVYTKCLTSDDVITLYNLYDGTLTYTQQHYQRTTAVHEPVSRITNLSDLSSLQGTPMLIYKYVNINETIVREIEV